MSAANVATLVEMGATLGQARAALARHKTIMEAADAVFRGDFDGPALAAHVDNGDHEEEDDDCVVTGVKRTATQSLAIDDDEEADEDAFEEADVDIVSISSDTVDQDADPYLGLSMRKDREELVIEVLEKPAEFFVELKDEGSDQCGSKVCAKEITQGEWLRGCPEGAEQSFLFGLYNDVTKSPFPCPKCSQANERKPKDLFVMLPTVESYLIYLKQAIVRQCAGCSAPLCLACGDEVCESSKSEKGKSILVQDDGAKEAGPPSRLLHCPEVQAIILGAGLAHFGELFDEPKEKIVRSHDEGQKGNPKKKIKTSTDVPTVTSEPADSDSQPHWDPAKKSLLDGKGHSEFSLLDEIPSPASSTPAWKSKSIPVDKDKPGKGTGYGGYDVKESTSWLEAHSKKVKEFDSRVCHGLGALRPFLPNLSRDPTRKSDHLPHVASIAQLRRRFLPIASRLMSSESLSDMCERHELYKELVEGWFKLFAAHESLAALLAQPIMLPSTIEVVKKTNFKERHVTYMCSRGPRELAQSVVIQCEGFLRGMELLKRNEAERISKLPPVEPQAKDIPKLKKSSSSFLSLRSPVPALGIRVLQPQVSTSSSTNSVKALDDESQRMVDFAKSFCSYVGIIDSRLRKTKGNVFVDRLIGIAEAEFGPECAHRDQFGKMAAKSCDDSDRKTANEKAIAAYERWARSERYADCDMTITTRSASSSAPKFAHAFDRDIKLVNAADNSKRGVTIAKELGGLRGSLPSSWHGSIFLRVDESRLDVLKACIVGPKGSPYEDGLFMFDIFMPAEYNNVSPLVSLRTTAGGKVRHNPNLYADGKVCLSLLGTWTGPGWVSGQSTLLQVLLSIQSLVMGVEEPALNEPGWSSMAGQPFSTAYSKNCRRQTVAVAMLDHLKSPEALWKDVIEGHFRLKGQALFTLLDTWLGEDDGHATVSDGGHYYHLNSEERSQTTKKGKDDFAKNVEQVKVLVGKLQEEKKT